ncbi:hypothetical protein JZ751_013885 [Albula glossodonta]|uniref:Uncharacterized protein n=1 Tax=Albula glossodonta TaxID=121402 RepID=A0A8T2MXE1_9TELE|nr:hypothetical protein JZ751_013885 [Albula glossodonta]
MRHKPVNRSVPVLGQGRDLWVRGEFSVFGLNVSHSYVVCDGGIYGAVPRRVEHHIFNRAQRHQVTSRFSMKFWSQTISSTASLWIGFAFELGSVKIKTIIY